MTRYEYCKLIVDLNGLSVKLIPFDGKPKTKEELRNLEYGYANEPFAFKYLGDEGWRLATSVLVSDANGNQTVSNYFIREVS